MYEHVHVALASYACKSSYLAMCHIHYSLNALKSYM